MQTDSDQAYSQLNSIRKHIRTITVYFLTRAPLGHQHIKMNPATETTGTVPPPAIPMHSPRTLVLCFDGTADQYAAAVSLPSCPYTATSFSRRDLPRVQNTNVVKFFSLLKKDNNDAQLCYYQVCTLQSPLRTVFETWYQAGLGTYFAPGVVSPLFNWGAKLLDEAVAWYLPAHVMGGYEFLMQNYTVGDKICIFGALYFSHRHRRN